MSKKLDEIKKLVVFSKKDIAGTNIVKILMDKFNFVKTDEIFDDNPIYEKDDISIVGCRNDAIHLKYLNVFKPEICVFASRHKSESEKPTLTCHSPGNFSTAEAGGNERELSIAPALYLHKAMNLLKIYGGSLPHNGYDISFEVTHHGPTNLSFPVIFVEVGSSEKQWNDNSACEVVSCVIYEILTNKIQDVQDVQEVKIPTAIGFGGPHYAPNFTKISDKIATGHIAPKYAVDFLNKEMIEQMINKTIPKPDFAVLDWKGLRGSERRNIIKILDDLGVEWKKTSDF